jgi:hypothetical protein
MTQCGGAVQYVFTGLLALAALLIAWCSAYAAFRLYRGQR